MTPSKTYIKRKVISSYCSPNRANRFDKIDYWQRWESPKWIPLSLLAAQNEIVHQSGIFNLHPRDCSWAKFYHFYWQSPFYKCVRLVGGGSRHTDPDFTCFCQFWNFSIPWQFDALMLLALPTDFNYNTSSLMYF